MADLRTFVLGARKSLIRETEEQLIQLYGLKPTGEFLSEKEVPALTRGDASKDAQEIRKKLKQLLKDEQEAGIAPSDALKKLTKEVAFTHLNRLVALKLLEGRKLMRGAVNNWHNSNAFLFYLSEHEDDQRLFEQGSQPIDDRGEGPSDRAYRHFLLWEFNKLAEEVKVLFDPANLASRLFPRPLVLRALVNELNGEELKDYWAPGNEETIGWVYQFFIAEEKNDAFARVFKKKQKFQKEDIAAATQIFTPRWIVEFLVQNSLGRLWVTMHPDSHLTKEMPYLVPMPADPPAATLKPAKEIRVLDPATGTMHFGLVAFDWLVRMYREELDNAGKPGWPAESSVKSDEEIAPSILANNLFGIDIDLRAVQLSALSLYLRAKQTNKNAKLIESRLACADIAIFRGQHLKKITDDLKLPNNLTGQLFSKFCESVDEAAQMGSLVRLETHFQNIEAERLRAVIDDYVSKKAAQGEDESYFANETSKGLRLLDIMTRRYDVVFTNPPYMSNRNMNPAMAAFLKSNYKKSKGDLYAAFIERCAEMLTDGGRMAMLTQQSFMFITSFEGLRELLLRNVVIENMVHTGPRAFAEVTGEKVNTTAYILRREGIGTIGQNAVGIYFRLVKEPDAQRKQAAFEETIGKRQLGETDPRVYEYRQADFAAIPGSPWVYWITCTLRGLFVQLPKFADIAKPRQGLATSDNTRFLRYWWEVGESLIDRHASNIESSIQSGKKWFPYMKGGSFLRWYGNQEFCVNWLSDGAEIRCVGMETGRVASRAQNTDAYFLRGVTWTDLTAGKFSARLSPGGFIFDVKGSSAFPNDIPLALGLLNSAFANYTLNLINPTLSYQVGDLSRLPVPTKSSTELQSLVDKAVQLSKLDSDEREVTYDFVAPVKWPDGYTALAERHENLESLKLEIDEEVYRLYGISDVDRRVIEDELSEPMEIAEGETEEDTEEDSEDSDVDNSAGSLTRNVLAKQWVSYGVGIALGRFNPGLEGALGRGTFPKETAERLRTLSSQDGLMVLQKGHPDDLAQRVWEILRAIQGDDGAEQIIRAAIGANGELRESLEGYLLAAFFKDHVRQYRKRPIYWLLQSPKRAFSIYLFHQRATLNTLPTLQGNRYVGGSIHRLEMELPDLLGRAARAESREKTNLTKRSREVAEILEDLKAFDAHLTAANQFLITGADGLPTTVRWEPEPDDGVLLNAAALHELAPAWKKADAKLDLKKAWKELEDGKYDWAKTAMRYWPGRVLKACKTNKSFSIAHELL
jgi:type I restriction-modification system DNA methylase subunit